MVVIVILIILLCGPCSLQCLVDFVTQRLIAFSHVGDRRAKVQYISIKMMLVIETKSIKRGE